MLLCQQIQFLTLPSMILNDEVFTNATLKRAPKHYTVVIEPKFAT